MNLIKLPDLKYLIPKDTFNICLIDNATKKEITKLFPSRKNGAYYLDKFSNYLKLKHNITLKDYCKNYLKIEWPKCPSKNIETGYNITGLGVVISHFSLGGITKKTCENFKRGCEKLSRDRMGKGNPRYGSVPWNKGLDNSHPIIKKISEARIGTKLSEETRAKMRQRRSESPIKARHTTKHSAETIQTLRENTARLWSLGTFNKITSIHIKMRDFLSALTLGSKLEEEWQVKYFSLDFAFPEKKIGIECQGTYYHIDPRVYPNGPINAMQRRNFGRDKAKRKFLCDMLGWKIIEVWETEINDGTFKEVLLCKLKELSLLKK